MMKRLGVFVLVLGLVGVAGCDDESASPSNLPVVLTAQLSPANEVPPVGNAENTGRGAAQITIHPTYDAAGAITGGTVDFHFQLSGFPDSLTIVGAHIHNAPAGQNAGVVVNTGIAAGSPVAGSGGLWLFSVTGVATTAATVQGILANPAAYYFNVHSPLNPGGFARGQLVRVV
jgi:hypothetical protein